MTEKPPIGTELRQKVELFHRSLFARLRTYFFAGILVTAPVAITVYLVYIFLKFVDGYVADLTPPEYHPHTAIPGIGLLIAISFFTLVGWLTRNVLGRLIVRISDVVFHRMPVIRTIYGTLKQIFETLTAGKSNAFREVVMFEYPRRDIWTIGFVTGPVAAEVRRRLPEEMVNIFIPAALNPTSGFLLFVPRKDLITLDMNVEGAMKLIISGGIIMPPEKAA